MSSSDKKMQIEEEYPLIDVLKHLGTYEEEPHTLIKSYFEGQHLERLVRHQIESYDHFVHVQIPRTIEMFNPVIIRHENDYVPEHKQYYLEMQVSFENYKLYPPQIHENTGATKIMFPQEAKLRGFTYGSMTTVDVHVKYIVRNTENMDTPQIINVVLPKIRIANQLPIMVKSSVCMLSVNRHLSPKSLGECAMDCGGYFVVKGSEKTVLGQERAAENRIYCFDGKNTTKWSWYAEMKSVPDTKCISPKQIEMCISNKNNGFGHPIFVELPRVKIPIELFVIFRALGITSDKDICKYILLDLESEGQAEILKCLQASIIEANKYLTQEDAIRRITSHVTYVSTNPNQTDKEYGARKRREYAMDILNNDIFPHCKTNNQRIYLLGYMANKLLNVSLGYLQPDDRDSYLNKRIDLTGTLLNNLFRNYFNKMVKEMRTQLLREINTGSWRSKEDFENILNPANVYKMIKPAIIENGILRALSTGDFSVKQSNSSKAGVAQVLNRLTYPAIMSHLRRINTPLEKGGGELIAPRKLHNTTWGFLCPVETPEGASIGVVKNLSCLAHVTIPIQNTPIYDFCLGGDWIQTVPDDISQIHVMFGKVKVIVNGIWLGICNNPEKFYQALKEQKCRGTINVYTSIVFDRILLEIRVCSDGGRLTRPLLRVKNGAVLLTRDVIEGVSSKKYSWNHLLLGTGSNMSEYLKEAVIEYIDPEEQNYAMIAMQMISAQQKKQTEQPANVSSEDRRRYTHCEIHPSTIFGILASCIPFPEHNQAPRNTYQCLDIHEMVWMSDGTQKEIQYLKQGDEVLTFTPDSTMGVSKTRVVGHFIQSNTQPVYKITTTGGREIIATDDHQFMTRDYYGTNTRWTRVSEMRASKQPVYVGIYTGTPLYDSYSSLTPHVILTIGQFYQTCESLHLNTSYMINHGVQMTMQNCIPLKTNCVCIGLIVRMLGMHPFIWIEDLEDNTIHCEFPFYTEQDARNFAKDVNLYFGEESDVKIYEKSVAIGSSVMKYYWCQYEGAIPMLLASLGSPVGHQEYMVQPEIPEWIRGHIHFAREYMRGCSVIDKCPKIERYVYTDYKRSLITYMEQYKEVLQNHFNIKCSAVKWQPHNNVTNMGTVFFEIAYNNETSITYMRDIGTIYNAQKQATFIAMTDYMKTMPESTVTDWVEQNILYDIQSNIEWVFARIDTIEHVSDRLVSDIEVEGTNHSFIAGQSGFASHNCAMGKQAIGIYATNYEERMDKTAYVLTYPSRPLVDTRLMNILHLDKVPSGTQIHVAIMTHTGYNQEDSVLVNKGSIDRGLFMATIYHTEKDEDRNIVRDEIIRGVPDPTKTKGIKFGCNYTKVNERGFMEENALIENRDILMAKVVPIKENRNDPTKVIKYEDQSKIYRTTEDTYVDKTYTGRNGDGYTFAKVRVRALRKPVLGDKFSSKHGQKGTCGNIIPECDMPFTKDGLRPDIIINPHAIPSRMTIAQLKETLLGKVLLELGMFGDGTSFGNLDVATIADSLSQLGYESYGNEILYNGQTGEQMTTSVFIGPTYYQRLKHMVTDKQHSRANGPVMNLTRQPQEGRSRDGGFRIGEMERDVMIAHGMSKFCRERLYDVSDKYGANICKKCGMIASYNNGVRNSVYREGEFSAYQCNTCNNTTDFAFVEIPYAYKLMAQELQAINVVPRIITEED
jgi:DNA-directed RNA polymerase beta subunit